MAEEKKNPLGPTGERVRQNLKRIREEKRLTFVELSALLSETGRPIPVLGLRRIERGERRVDADDLAALAVVLNVGLTALLLPPDWTEDQIELTPGRSVSSSTAWRWAEGQGTAMDEPRSAASAGPTVDPAISRAALEREEEWARKQAEFLALTLPPGRRRARENQAVRLGRSLVEIIEDLVDPYPGSDRATLAALGRMARGRHAQLGIELDEIVEQLPPVHPGLPIADNDGRENP